MRSALVANDFNIDCLSKITCLTCGGYETASAIGYLNAGVGEGEVVACHRFGSPSRQSRHSFADLIKWKPFT